ncbi:AraC family ligand binding domain-containing protein, partial [Streptomyces griseus]|uniref:AraC family ligand binding domain-containing protein n=1 Tax=Streptomyces griseus TaxID=1911 RepID=UPI0031E753C7
MVRDWPVDPDAVLYVLGVAARQGIQDVAAWRPAVAGVVEVFHARFTEHAYPMHVHDAWTLLIVDDGAVRYDLDRHERGTPDGTVSLLPPGVPHNGSPATTGGFRKRVLYLDMTHLDAALVGPAVDTPDLADPLLRTRVGRLHTALADPGDAFEAESRLAFIGERLRAHLRPGGGRPGPPARRRGGGPPPPPPPPPPPHPPRTPPPPPPRAPPAP